MTTVLLHTDEGDLLVLKNYKGKKFRIGSVCKINGADFHVWYIESTKEGETIRLERLPDENR